MNFDTNPDEEKEVIGKLFVKEEDTIKKLDRIVTMLSKYISIEESSGRVFFLKKDLSIEQKIFLVLIGKYLHDRVKKEGEGELNLAFIAKDIDKPITTLPVFVQRLISAGFITRVSRGKYKPNYYKIEDFLEKMEHA
jgi:hypothetical protein